MTGTVLTRLVAGAPHRKTRLHDELGNRVPLARLIRNAPAALATGLVRLATGRRGIRPWISYDAQRLIDAFLTKQSRVLEFGSGMSTVWYAKRAGEVVSIEDNPAWFAEVERIMVKRGVTNLRYRLATDRRSYTAPTFDEQGGGFDLVMVDGSTRDECVRTALGMLRAGGLLYLDNSDKGVSVDTGDVPAARRMLVNAAVARGGTIRYFTDFAPTQLFVQQGMLLRLPPLS